MTNPIRKSRIGVLTGGGDCAGLNPALKWVVKTAMDENLEWERGVRYEVLGIRDGWKGLTNIDLSSPDTEGRITSLNPEIVRTWDRYGGTMLGTSRFSPYDPETSCSGQIIENIKRLDRSGDSHRRRWHSPQQRVWREANIISIPKTIDKDLKHRLYLGYETA
jgi:6-phosphofructokinase 1